MFRLALAVFIVSSSTASAKENGPAACGVLLSSSHYYQEKMDQWLDRLRARQGTSPRYPRLRLNLYGESFDHHNFVLTFSADELEQYALTFREGLAYLGANTEPLTTNSFLQRVKLRPLGNLFAGGRWMYVMTCEGKILTIPDGLDVRHSSLADRLCVAAAGWMDIDHGRVLFVDNNSGHYHPNPFTVAQVLYQLHSQGMDISRVAYDLIGM